MFIWHLKFIHLVSIFIKDLYVFVHFWTLKNHVLANYLAPNGPISILIEVLDFWVEQWHLPTTYLAKSGLDICYFITPSKTNWFLVVNLLTLMYVLSRAVTSSHDIPCQIWTRYVLFLYTPGTPIDFQLSIYYHFICVLSRAVTSSHDIPCQIWTRWYYFITTAVGLKNKSNQN